MEDGPPGPLPNLGSNSPASPRIGTRRRSSRELPLNSAAQVINPNASPTEIAAMRHQRRKSQEKVPVVMQADTPEDTRDLLRFLPTVLTEQLHKMILSKKEGSERQRRSVFSPG